MYNFTTLYEILRVCSAKSRMLGYIINCLFIDQLSFASVKMTFKEATVMFVYFTTRYQLLGTLTIGEECGCYD